MAYSVEEAKLEQAGKIIFKIWENNLANPRKSSDKWEWYYFKNPFGRGRCWFLRDSESGAVVGSAGMGRRRLKIGDRVTSCGLMSDLAVDKPHRILKPAILLQQTIRHCVGGDVDLAYGFPNPQATAVMTLAGFRKVGQLTRYARVLKHESFIHDKLLIGPLSGIVGKCLDWLSRVWFSKPWIRMPMNHVLEDIHSFDYRFDELWERCKSMFLILGVRSSQFLTWRYAQCPLAAYQTVGLVDRSLGRLQGYIVFHHSGQSIHIVDMFFESFAMLDVLLKELFVKMRNSEQRSISISLLAPWQVIECLASFGFVSRNEHRAFVLAGNGAGDDLIYHSESWYLVTGDDDYV
jgi:hypothetical protein